VTDTYKRLAQMIVLWAVYEACFGDPENSELENYFLKKNAVRWLEFEAPLWIELFDLDIKICTIDTMLEKKAEAKKIWNLL